MLGAGRSSIHSLIITSWINISTLFSVRDHSFASFCIAFVPFGFLNTRQYASCHFVQRRIIAVCFDIVSCTYEKLVCPQSAIYTMLTYTSHQRRQLPTISPRCRCLPATLHHSTARWLRGSFSFYRDRRCQSTRPRASSS